MQFSKYSIFGTDFGTIAVFPQSYHKCDPHPFEWDIVKKMKNVSFMIKASSQQQK